MGLATPISRLFYRAQRPANSAPGGQSSLSGLRAGRAALLTALWLSVCSQVSPFVQGVWAGETEWAAAAARDYQAARTHYKLQPRDEAAGWQFARACSDFADFATNSSQRAGLAGEGIAACEQILSRNSNSASAHYYKAVNLGQLAMTRGLGALKLIKSMQQEFEAARQLDETIDHGGPDRGLGLLYRDAPSIGSVGSRSRARLHLQRAVELAPDFPENRLDLIEAYVSWSDRNGARRELKALEEIWPGAHNQYRGLTWASSWADWEQRFNALKKKIEEPPKVLESPRNMP
jgi:hypothetical protein